MRILHITAMKPLSANSGIPAVLKYLTYEQNKIPGVEARVLSLCSKVDMMDSEYFDEWDRSKTNEYLCQFNPDIAIFHSFFHTEFAILGRVLKKKGIPFFIEPHGSFGKQAMKKSALKKQIANHTIFRFLIHDAKGFIYTIDAERNDAVYESRTDTVIPNGVNSEVILSSSEKDLDKISCPIFYFLGRYDIHHKGLDYLLDALSILDTQNEVVTVRLYGIGNEEQNKYINDRISKFSNVDVREMGTIYGDEKKQALENVNILLLTSRYEGSPMTILDGFCYGNPCLVTPGTNVADEAINNGVGWKTELDPTSIADCILKAKKDYIKNGLSYYKKCKQYVLENYTWKKIASLSISEYERLISTK